VALAAPLPGQIVTDDDNPSWLRYEGGGPFFLASPGDPEDFLYRGSRNGNGTRNGDQDAIIAKLSPTGANGIYMQIIRSNGGDGNDTHNPFVNNEPSQGLNEAVLAQWDGWFTAMDSAGIVIYLFFYDDSASIWNTGDSVGSAERQFVEAIVNRFEGYRHLIWVVAEEYSEALTQERASEIAAIIRATDDHDHPIGVHKLNGLTFNDFANDPNVEQFAMQYNVTSPSQLHSGVVSAWNTAAGRYNLNMSEATSWGTGSAARRKAWASAMGGAYVMGLGMDVINTPASDLEDLGRLRNFFEATDFDLMAPRDDLAHAETDWLLANPGTSYIAYGQSVDNALGVEALPASSFELRWLDTASGATQTQADVAVGGGDSSFTKPAGFGDEVALYVKLNASDPAPNPPQNVVVE
ncbi:MAG: DUF4038 domain-containing protein, partial [Pseudomonadota bacterium]